MYVMYVSVTELTISKKCVLYIKILRFDPNKGKQLNGKSIGIRIDMMTNGKQIYTLPLHQNEINH